MQIMKEFRKCFLIIHILQKLISTNLNMIEAVEEVLVYAKH